MPQSASRTLRTFVFAAAAAFGLSLALSPLSAAVVQAAEPPVKTKAKLVPINAEGGAKKAAKAAKPAKAAAKKVRTAKASSGGKAVRASVRTAKSKASAKRASAKRTSLKKSRVVRRRQAAPSQATLAGLRKTEDPLRLGSSVAFAVDQDTGEELVVKNADVPLPIASVTKLMTAYVLAESDLPLDEKIRITRDDYVRSSAVSKLRSGMVMTREAVLKAALMSSDNRAAHALARTYPGGIRKFIGLMNEKAAELGMKDSFFADPTGLDNRNHATARDLSKLVAAVYEYQAIRSASTAPAATLRAGKRSVSLRTTNRLIGDPSWRIGIQKTGFTTAAGRCMVVQSEVGERRLVMVVLDSPDNNQRAADMRTMRAYVEAEPAFAEDFAEVLPYRLF